MKNKKITLAIVLVFVLLLAGAYALYHKLGQEVSPRQMLVHTPAQPTSQPLEESAPQETESPADEQPQTTPAPDFHVYTREGDAVRLSDFFGKPIVLNFWASWCGPCQLEMPDFNEKYAEIGDSVHFVMVNATDGSRETVETASAFIEENNYSFPVFFDTSSEAGTVYGAYSLPTTFFINADGHVVAQAVGAIDSATLQKGIDMIAG